MNTRQSTNLFINDDRIYNSSLIEQAVAYAHIVKSHNVGPIQSGTKILCTSIFELSNIKDKLPQSLQIAVDTLSNKHLFREHLASVYPDFYFTKVRLCELTSLQLDFSEDKTYVIKPIYGAASVGVGFIQKDTDLHKLKLSIAQQLQDANQRLNGVYSLEEFIIEECIGTEFNSLDLDNDYTDIELVIDMFYNEQGQPVITSIIHHPFATDGITKYAFHYTDAHLIKRFITEATFFFEKFNEGMQLVGFPIHGEFKIRQGKLFPLELNPLRFAGTGVSELFYHAYNINVYEIFFKNEEIDWQSILNDCSNSYYGVVIGFTPSNCDDESIEHEKFKTFCGQVIEYNQKRSYHKLIFSHAFIKAQEKKSFIKFLDINFSHYVQTNATHINVGSIFKVCMGAWSSQCLLSAIELGVFQYLHTNGMASSHDIAIATQITLLTPSYFFDVLVLLGLLIKNDLNMYENSPIASKFCIKGTDQFCGEIVKAISSQESNVNWFDLSKKLQVSSDQKFTSNYNIFYEILDQSDAIAGFIAEQSGLTAPITQFVARQQLWTQISSFVDVGGSNGFFAKQICNYNPNLSGIVCDLPPVQPHFNLYINQYNMQDRITFKCLDYMKDDFPSTDCVVMSHVMMDHTNENQKFLLAKAFKSLKQDGYLILCDTFVDTDNLQALLTGIHMQLCVKAVCLTRKEWTIMLQDIGFKVGKIENFDGLHTGVIIAQKNKQ
eukprot:403370874